MTGVNRSEKLSYDLCKGSFLSLWSYAVPRLQNGKEVCDILVVFGNEIVIFSVKDVQFGENAEESVALGRWRRKAIRESVRQIYKARTWILKGLPAFSSDQKKQIAIPDPKNLKIHQVAIALGSKGKVNIESANFGKGFVHVYDEESTYRLLRELDTITDFVDYLNAVESFLSREGPNEILLTGGHRDLLALYLFNSRSFPQSANLLIVGDDVWDGFEARPEVKRRREEDKKSYLWDALIETLAKHERDKFLGVCPQRRTS